MPSKPRSVYLWCPAYPLADRAQCERAVGAAHWFAEALGLTLAVSPLLERTLAPGAWLPLAERVADAERGLDHDLLLAARGGYGCTELMPALRSALATRGGAPALMGYSDLTAWHGLWRRQGWGPSWYGFMPGVTAGGRALATAISLVAGDDATLDPASDPRVVVVRQGRAEGPLFPACLRILASLVGTPAMPDLSGCILALEDIDERPYRVDRDLGQLHAAGALQDIVGLVFGSFPCRDEPAGYGGPSFSDIARQWADRLAIPTLFGLPFGHESDPLTLPCGAEATLRAEDGWWRLQLAGRGM